MSVHCVVFMCFYFLLQHFAAASSIITSSEPLIQGKTLVSLDGDFELGFFDPNNSGNHYVGIWYKNISPRVVVWVANRENPALDSPSSLQIGSEDGNLRLVDANQELIWSTNVSASSNGSVAEFSNGNLALRDSISRLLWQSGDNPSDTVVPGTWKVSVMTSWKSENDPSLGPFTVSTSPNSPPQTFTWKDGKPYWRSGQWDKSKFIGIKGAEETYLSYYGLIDDTEEGIVSVIIRIVGSCEFANLAISPSGDLNYMCYETGKGWSAKWQEPQSQCDVYGACGPFAVCLRSEPITCECLDGFTPKTPEQWNKRNWTEGCVRRTELSCVQRLATNATEAETNDGFSRIRRLKLPDFSEYVEVSNEGCRQQCLMNCTCQAYAFVNGIGCLVWSTPVLDVSDLSPQGEDLYIRLANSELAEGKKPVKWIIGIIALSSFVVFCMMAFCFLKKRAKERLNRKARIPTHHSRRSTLEVEDPIEVPLVDWDDILDTTNNFSAINKLGQGGFGPVYKGILNGKDVAIKRLSSSSVQGADEFKTEILLISKLQHRNLVRLVGYCIEREEKILIYEFMPNKSLDTYLNVWTKNTVVLDWPQRFNIILGIARGMSYLHRDSRLRVIHRDLKASNILLDEKMNPKISDFGLARIFEGTQVLARIFEGTQVLRNESPRDSSHAFMWQSPLEDNKDALDLPLFDFNSILVATNNFDTENKLGQGGYGPVYKGKLMDGKDIAIKRLSSSSGQGINEFKNEVKLISKLQHRNLVKLIGCCVEREEKILIYEFMPNKSLDTYLFDSAKKAELDWAKRLNIITGVARGLLYLHRDSCLRVVHRDLKVSNILLDEKMYPKISDFGLARIFEGTQDLGSTHKVVGTIGYMAPEYLLGGLFSEKSDVYGFGVLTLEIVSGRKASSFQFNEQHLSLLAYAWQSWITTRGVDMVDEATRGSFLEIEVSRCVNIGLLCVQDNSAERPTMASIVSMLSGEKTNLPEPKQPTFTFRNVAIGTNVQSQSNSTWSVNNVTETAIEPR